MLDIICEKYYRKILSSFREIFTFWQARVLEVV